MKSARPLVLVALALFAAAPLAACRSTYYSLWETFGREKRDLLRSAMQGMVGDQEEAGETFTTALERVKALTGFQGGSLEAEYDKLKGAYDDAEDSAKQIDERTKDIEDVAADLFDEWDKEIGTMQAADLKSASRRKLSETKARYERAHASMLESRSRMSPALALLHDHVLYLKHNLNAAAVGSLMQSMGGIERSVADLQTSLEASIREAKGFLETMQE